MTVNSGPKSPFISCKPGGCKQGSTFYYTLNKAVRLLR